MQRAVLLLAVMALAMVVASGVALANNIQGNGADNRLVGTNGKDTISGGGGDDRIFGKGGRDRLVGDGGNDHVYGGAQGDRIQGGSGQDDLFGQQGNDFVNAIDGQPNDVVDCGSGAKDVAGIDIGGPFGGSDDRFSANCEAVYIGVGPFPANGGPGLRPSGVDISKITTVKQAEQAVDEGLLRQIR